MQNLVDISNGITNKEAPVIQATDNNARLGIEIQRYLNELQKRTEKATLHTEQDQFFYGLMLGGSQK